MSGNLKPAHAGYRYQDIITAYFFVLGIIEKFDSVTVDKKQLDDDRFDDLQIIKKDGFKKFKLNIVQMLISHLLFLNLLIKLVQT